MHLKPSSRSGGIGSAVMETLLCFPSESLRSTWIALRRLQSECVARAGSLAQGSCTCGPVGFHISITKHFVKMKK